jgi:hypothetical protein
VLRFKVAILGSTSGISQSLLMLMRMNPLVPLLHLSTEVGEDLSLLGKDNAETDG